MAKKAAKKGTATKTKSPAKPATKAAKVVVAKPATTKAAKAPAAKPPAAKAEKATEKPVAKAAVPVKAVIAKPAPVKEEKPAKAAKTEKLEKAGKVEKAEKKVKVDKSGLTEEQARWVDLYQKYKAEKPQVYNMTAQFEANKPIQHKVLGWGYVLSNENDRLEVLFEQGVKMLISNYKPA